MATKKLSRQREEAIRRANGKEHARRRRSCSRGCAGKLRDISGDKNFNWKGGYLPYYGPTWHRARRTTRERDKVCQDCGKTPEGNGKALDVHHITPFREFGVGRHEEANQLSNLVALCHRCHLLREPRPKKSRR